MELHTWPLGPGNTQDSNLILNTYTLYKLEIKVGGKIADLSF